MRAESVIILVLVLAIAVGGTWLLLSDMRCQDRCDPRPGRTEFGFFYTTCECLITEPAP